MEQQQGGSLDLHEEGEISVSLLLLLLLYNYALKIVGGVFWCFLAILSLEGLISTDATQCFFKQ